MNITNLTTIISIFMECLIFIYYSNSALIYINKRSRSNMIIIAGYFILLIICLLGIPTLNVIAFVIVNFLILYFGFDECIGAGFLKIIVLTVLMMFSELMIALCLNISINEEIVGNMSWFTEVAFTFISKLTYAISVVMLKHTSVRKKRAYKTQEVLWFLILPLATCLFLSLFNELGNKLNSEFEMIFVIISILMIASNFIFYIICDRMIDKDIQIQEFQSVEYKRELDYKSYQLLLEKYDELRIMIHDFNKYCNNIEAMLGKNDNDAVAILTKAIKNKNKEFLLIEYTDNKTLNVLLAQKMSECNKKGIDFTIYIQPVTISFIDEIDIIAIFSNLIDNAIEGCINSPEKKIFLNIYKINQSSYIVINIENSCDNEPITEKGRLKTIKSDKMKHGIGIMSIEKSVKKYNGSLEWKYDKKQGIFSNTILFKCVDNEI